MPEPDSPIDWDGIERRASKNLSRRVLIVAPLIAAAVAAVIQVCGSVYTIGSVRGQIREGQSYNCNQNAVGRVQGRSRAFVQRQKLLNDVAIRQLSAKADRIIADNLQAQLRSAPAGTPAQARRAVAAYVRAFRLLQEVSATASAYWQDELVPLIKQLPQIPCDAVFADDDSPPAVTVPREPALPTPPPILRPTP